MVRRPGPECNEPYKFNRYSSVRKFDLVFEGGGAKGSVFVGALQEFERRKYAGGRFVGTSAGAITATLLAAGYTADAMLAAVNEKLPDGKPRFSSFMDIPINFDSQDIETSVTYAIFQSVDLQLISDRPEKKIDKLIISRLMTSARYRELFSFVERGGLYEGNRFLEWLREKLDADCRNLGDVTMAQFHEITGNDLTLVASDTTAQQKLILNHRTAPDCPVVWAVRMSMSIPFVWQEVRWQKKWGNYRGAEITGHTIVDGGVLSNFPIDLVTSQEREITQVMGTLVTDTPPRLGLLIDETIAVPGAAETPGKEESSGVADDLQQLKTVQRIRRLIDTMTDAHDKLVIQAHENEICRLPAKGYGTTEFDMSEERLRLLIKAGKETMEGCLRRMGL